MNLSLHRDVVRLVRGVGDLRLAVWVSLIVASGLAPVATVFVTREVIDALVPVLGSRGRWTDVSPLAWWAAAASIVALLSQLLQGGIDWARAVQAELLRDQITARLHRQSVRLDLAFYDVPEFFDRLHRARDEANYRPAALLEGYGDVLQGGVTLLGMAILLVTFEWWIPVALVAGALPVLLVVTRHASEEQRWRRSVTADERRTWYHDEVLTTPQYAAEVRLFNLGDHFRAAHAALRSKMRGERLELVRRRWLAEGLAGAGGLIVTAAAFAWMVSRAILGAVTLGQLAAFYQAFVQGLTALRQLLSGIGRVHANRLFMEDLFAFLALQPRIAQPAAPELAPPILARGIRFRDVTFQYPGSNHAALNRFNLYIPAGRSVAIVGPNGAGKSTLVKLVTRLYDPADGSIEIDDVDLRAFAVTDLREAVTALFQEPARYAESVSDNISMGVLGDSTRERLAGDSQARPWAMDGQVERVATMAGVRFAEDLPNGFDTQLGARFDQGTELSTGEWQRIALARAFLRPSPLLILDEPTSALDPWAETDWYRRFREAARGRTSILITHRLTTAMQADVIHIMESGRIVESGSHAELIARDGPYAALWAEQMAERRAGSRPMAAGAA
jgi:ATP-binding cassette subfamily B protein